MVSDSRDVRRVLVVGMLDSVHFVRWLQHFEEEELSFLIFPSSPHRRLHPELKLLLGSKKKAIFRLAPGSRYLGLPLWVLDKAFANLVRSALITLMVRLYKPNFLHALELQNAGYVVAQALRWMREDPPTVVATNYGSDLFWFARRPRHAAKLSALLAKVDRYAAECERDVEIAKSLGYQGKVMPVRPNAGGFDAQTLNLNLVESSRRSLIMVKGYHGWVGRAHIALRAIESMSVDLRDYEVAIFSCNYSTKRIAKKVAKHTGLKIRAYSKGALSHVEMIEKFSQSLVYVGLSLSDGISTSMLEAMAMGAIPVQTSTSCCDEWFTDTGVAIDNMTVEEVAQGIQRAINLARETDSAAKNREIVRERASREEITRQALTYYQL